MANFDSFVVLAGMRTGSNLLEEELNSVPGLSCLGEVFNPHFVGHPKKDALLGLSLAERDRDPGRMLARMAGETEALLGFRLFQDHDDRVLTHCLAEPRIAKVVLTRNPVDSYVSLKIARATGQWWLGDVSRARSAKARFDADDFERFLEARRAFYLRVNRALQTSGQTAFHLDYADLADTGVLAGLVRFLGVDGGVDPSRVRAKVQNPAPLADKVENFAELEDALARADYFDLGRIPSFEPVRGPGVPGFLISDAAALLYMPLRGGPTEFVANWLAAAGGAAPRSGLKQKDIRQWKRQTPGHKSFTVVSHPLARAHAVFVRRILSTGEDAYPEIRALLRERHELPIPEEAPGPGWSAADHRAAFLSFLGFLKRNLGGQTSIRIDPDWASQTGLLQKLAEVMVPDRVLRTESLSDELPALLAPKRSLPVEPWGDDGRLAEIYDREIETVACAAYPRDYMMFGYGAWSG